MVLLIHHLRRSMSERIIWLCEELSIPYELKCYNRDPTTLMAPPEYKALTSLGTSPVVDDGPVRITESAACVEYVLRKHAPTSNTLLVGPEDANYAVFLRWYHFGVGTLFPALMGKMMLSGPAAEQVPAKFVADARFAAALAAMEERLGETRYLGGEAFTAADIMALFYLTTMRAFMGVELTPWPNVLRWVGEVGTRPAYVRALEKGDPGFKAVVDAVPAQLTLS